MIIINKVVLIILIFGYFIRFLFLEIKFVDDLVFFSEKNSNIEC